MGSAAPLLHDHIDLEHRFEHLKRAGKAGRNVQRLAWAGFTGSFQVLEPVLKVYVIVE